MKLEGEYALRLTQDSSKDKENDLALKQEGRRSHRGK